MPLLDKPIADCLPQLNSVETNTLIIERLTAVFKSIITLIRLSPKSLSGESSNPMNNLKTLDCRVKPSNDERVMPLFGEPLIIWSVFFLPGVSTNLQPTFRWVVNISRLPTEYHFRFAWK